MTERESSAWTRGGPLGKGWAARAMTRLLATGEAAAPNGSGAGRETTAVVNCGVYLDGKRMPGDFTPDQALSEACSRDGAFVWLGLHHPSEGEMAAIAHTYGLHELAVEDAVKAEQRPKLEQFGEVQFLVLRTARYVPHQELTESSQVVETGQMMIFIGERFVITVRHGDASEMAPVRADLESHREVLLQQGPWAVAYAVTDRVVDHYLEVADQVEADLDIIEEGVFSRDRIAPIQQVYQLKRELVEFRRAVVPLQRPLAAITSSQGVVPKEIRRYFRDVQDHLTRTVEQVSSYDDLLNSILQARLAQVTVDQNNDMRKIASWAAIATVWTAFAGVYGMNFDYMPETGWKYGYPALIAVLSVVTVVLYRALRRNGWL
ncbi:magnesium and cobalt transport protein CorA [Actinoplanes sp. GCM10030250]|uniref:magnesium and cobalt transport protein CorA n=1 Tax=Actinoplanes sp. GCM10030250 TaxID=3273376 RepID=UPI0036237F53